MGEERKLSARSLANRGALVGIPLIGLVATFLTLVIGYSIPWEEAVSTSVAFGLDTYLWIAVGVGAILLICDFLLPKRTGLIFGFFIAGSLFTAFAGWVIGEALMHI
jgi:hypothetical protein